MGIIYTYDETLDGLLCCVFESYVRKEIPESLLPEGTPTFFPVRRVVTNPSHAQRVWRALHREVAEWVQIGWLSCVEERGDILFHFIRAAFTYGPSVCQRNAHPAVTPVLNVVRTTCHEAHMYCGFVRFSDYDGILAAQISPKAMVLPLLETYFSDRYAAETFLIYDITHGQALFHENGKTAIRTVDFLELDAPGEAELLWQRLWRCYYKSTAIRERYNPKCRMTQMSKRFWKHLTEFQEEPSDNMVPVLPESRSTQESP